MITPYELRIDAASLNRYRCNHTGLSEDAKLAKIYNKGSTPRYRRINPNETLTFGAGVEKYKLPKHPSSYGIRFDSNDMSSDITMCPDDQIPDHSVANALLTAVGYRPVSAYSKRQMYYGEPDSLMHDILASVRNGVVEIRNFKYCTQQLQKTLVSDSREYSPVQVKFALQLRNGPALLYKGYITKKMFRLVAGDIEYNEYMALFDRVSGTCSDCYTMAQIIEYFSANYSSNSEIREFFDKKSAILDAMNEIEVKNHICGRSNSNSACTNMLFYDSVQEGVLVMNGRVCTGKSGVNLADCYKSDPVLYASILPTINMGKTSVAVFDASVVIPASQMLVDRIASICYFSKLEGGPITNISILRYGETDTNGWKPVFVTPFTLEHGMPSKEQ